MILTTFLLPLAVSAVVIEERQLGGSGGAGKLAGVDKLKPRYRATAQRTLTKFGRKFQSIHNGLIQWT
jgi:hypothetical protein